MLTSTNTPTFLDGNVAILADSDMLIYSMEQPFALLLTFGFFEQEEFIGSIAETIYESGGDRNVWIQRGDIL